MPCTNWTRDQAPKQCQGRGRDSHPLPPRGRAQRRQQLRPRADAPAGYALANGKRAVYILATKRSDASTLSVINNIKNALPKMRDALGAEGEGIDVRFEFDQSPYVTRAVAGVVSEGLLGAFLVGLMVLAHASPPGGRHDVIRAVFGDVFLRSPAGAALDPRAPIRAVSRVGLERPLQSGCSNSPSPKHGTGAGGVLGGDDR